MTARPDVGYRTAPPGMPTVEEVREREAAEAEAKRVDGERTAWERLHAAFESMLAEAARREQECAAAAARRTQRGFIGIDEIDTIMRYALEGSALRAIAHVSPIADEIVVRIYSHAREKAQLRHEARISSKSLAVWRFDTEALGKWLRETIKAAQDADHYAEMFE